MANGSLLSLAVGDRVVYPNQGVCRVSAVEAMEISGQKLTFVTMKREEDGAVVRVPQAKVQAIGLRKVATSQEVAKIFDYLGTDSDRADLDWKQRARTNVDRMTVGGLRGLAEVVKGLQVLSELRPLPNKERELYDNARHLLVSEISVALGISECDAEDAVDIVLFPVGKERPKRTAEEFKSAGEEELELGGDLMELGGEEAELPEEPAPEPAEEEEAEEEVAPKAPAPSKPQAVKKPKAERAAKPKSAPAPKQATKAPPPPKKTAKAAPAPKKASKAKAAPKAKSAPAKKKR